MTRRPGALILTDVEMFVFYDSYFPGQDLHSALGHVLRRPPFSFRLHATDVPVAVEFQGEHCCTVVYVQFLLHEA